MRPWLALREHTGQNQEWLGGELERAQLGRPSMGALSLGPEAMQQEVPRLPINKPLSLASFKIALEATCIRALTSFLLGAQHQVTKFAPVLLGNKETLPSTARISLTLQLIDARLCRSYGPTKSSGPGSFSYLSAHLLACLCLPYLTMSFLIFLKIKFKKTFKNPS